MNTSYKSIWNESLGAWVAASEVTKGRGKRSRSGAAVAAALVVLAGVAGLSCEAFAAGDFEAVGTPGTGAITVSPSGSSTNASAAGTNAIAVGTSATAPAVSAVAVGVNATAGVSGGGSGAAALGSGTKATGESSVAIGGGNGTGNSENNNAAVASADRSVAVGHNSNATAVNAVAIGTDAIASGSGSVAIGADAGGAATANVANAGAKATGPYSIAVGGMSQATGQSALAFGTGATAVFGNDMAFGTNAYASGDSSSLAPSTAFGNKSKATNYGTAFGVGAQALSYGSIAFGGDAKSGVDGGTRGVAMGVLAAVSGDRGVAIGAGASSAGDRAVAYGWKTSAAASGAVAIGANADGGAAALAVGSIAIGGQSSVASAATSGIALGRGATTKGAFGIAQGDGATASEKNAIGIGTNAAASDANAIAVGDASKAKGLNSMAMGHQANAAGSHATALGADASALYDDSVALGSSSKTSATLAALQSTAAHTPFKGATIAGATPAGEVSVGADGSERRVTNVAAGGAGTDAVNVSQLQAASTAAVQYDKNADGTLNKGSVTLGGTPATAPVKLGNVADGNVAAGSKDAVNGGQLNAVSEIANKGWNLSANGEGAAAQKIAPGDTVDFVNGSNTTVTRTGKQIKVDVSKTPVFDSVTAASGTPGAPGSTSATLGANGLTTTGADGKAGPSVTTAGIDAGGKPITNVGAGTNDTDAANVAQVKAAEAKAGNVVQYDKNADGTPGKSGVTLGGLNADGTPATAPVKLANVADGNVAAGSKDAVNGGQLNTTNQNVTNLGDSIRNGAIGPVQAVPGKTDQLTLVAPGATSAAPGNAQVLGNVANGTAPNDAVNRGQLDTVSAAINKGWNLSANGEASPLNIAPGGAVDFVNGSNTTVSRAGNQIKVDVSKTPVFDSATAASGTPGAPGSTSATLGANGLTTTGADGKAGPSVTTTGIDAGGKAVTNVGAGEKDTDAANMAQVKAVEAKTDNAVQYDAKDGAPGKESITLGGLNADGTPATAPVKLGNVADGNVAAGSKDAVNGGQLNATNTHTNTFLGGGADVASGKAPTYDVAGGSFNDVGSALGAVDKLAGRGWNLGANGEASPLNIAPGGAVDFINGSNTTVSRAGNQIKVDVSKTPTFETVTATNGTPGNPGASATLGANGLTTTGADGRAGPSVTTAGIDAGGKPVTNVGAGEKDTDAANVAQVKAAQANAGNAVQYDKNADGTPGKRGVTLGGLNADGTPATAPVKLANVADGNVAAGSKDAVNGGQLNTTNQNVTNLGDSIRNGAIGPVQAVPGKTDQLTLVAPGATSAAPGNAQVLSNVANGTAPNDAVNRGQLDMVSASVNKGWNLSANGEASPLNIAPGGAVDFINGSNTTVIRTGNQIKVDVSKTPTFDSVTATNGTPGNPGASATLGASGLTTTGADSKAGPSVTTVGIDAGGKPISNVGAGTNGTDAANVDQVKAVEAKADNAVQYDAKDGAPGKDSITLGGLNADGTPATAPVKLANVADGNVAAGSKDAVNGGQLNTTNQNVTNLGDSIRNGAIGPVQAVPGKTNQLTLVAPGATGDAPGNAQVLGNVADGKAPTDAANVGQLDALAGSAVQYDKNADGTPGKSAVTLGGKNADGTPATDPVKLGNVADGNVAAGSKDAVNGGQLNTTNTHTNTFLGGGADVASGKAPTYDVAGGSFNDVGSALGAVDKLAGRGWNLSANGEATPQQIVPGGAVDFINGSNTTVIRTGNQIKVDVSKTPTFDSVTATTGTPGNPGASATLGANGLTTTGADGKAGPSVTTAGIDAGGKPISNVGAGTNGTDAANVAQVKAVEAKADNAVQYDAKDGAPGKDSITLGGLNADGTPATAPVKLANVADGNVAAGSKDAINGGQLNTLGSGIANVLGGTYVGGVYTPSAFTTVGGGSATTVQGALDNLGTVLSNGAVGPVQRTGKDDQLALVAPGATGAAPGAAQQLTNVKNGELSSTSTDAVNGSQLHAVNEAVAAVGTKADNSVQYDKGADGAPGKAGITLGGMGADGKTPSTGPVKLGNVADGNLAEGSKDAVNGGQLFATNQNVTNLGNDLKNLSTSVNDGKVGPLQRTDNANELVLVGKDGTAANPGAAQRVTNVANGTGAGDAVNFGQLQEVASKANNSVQYDGADKGAVTMGGATSTDGGKTGGTRLGNVAQGAVNDKSTDAVNGAQLNATHTAVSNYLGGGANLNEGKGPSYNVQGNTYDNVGGALGSVNDNLTTVNNAINGGGMKYFRANSTLPDAMAGGTDAVAVGPQAVANGASSVAVGSGAQATSASGTAIGFKAVVQQTGGVALGAGSVASTAAGVAGHVPEGAGAQQASAVRATTSTQGAVSVGDAGSGQFRQITGVAAGTADSDAANVAQLKASASAVKAGSVQYDTRADGSINHGQITMGNGQAPDGTRISNVAPGVQGTDAVNLNQLNSAAAASMNYTDARFNQLGNAMRDIEKKSYAGTAAAMALENAPYVPGKVSYAAGMGHYQGQTAVGASLRKTAESGRWSVSGGVTATSAGTVGVRAGISGVWD